MNDLNKELIVTLPGELCRWKEWAYKLSMFAPHFNRVSRAILKENDVDADGALWWMLDPRSAVGLDIDQPVLCLPGASDPLQTAPLQFAWWDESFQLLALRESGDGNGALMNTMSPNYQPLEDRQWPDTLVVVPLYRMDDGSDYTIDSQLVMADMVHPDEVKFFKVKKYAQRQIIRYFMQ